MMENYLSPEMTQAKRLREAMAELAQVALTLYHTRRKLDSLSTWVHSPVTGTHTYTAEEKADREMLKSYAEEVRSTRKCLLAMETCLQELVRKLEGSSY